MVVSVAEYGINFINFIKDVDDLQNLSLLLLFIKDVCQTMAS
jgi:hypothetical protein